MPCPYLMGERCKIFDTHQDASHRQNYCMSTENCTNCANFRTGRPEVCPYLTLASSCNGPRGGGAHQSGETKRTRCLNGAYSASCPNYQSR